MEIKDIINKVQWSKEEINEINKIIEVVEVKPKGLSYDTFNNFVEFDGKQYSGILRHKLFDWFDVAKIIDYLNSSPKPTDASLGGKE